MPKLIKIQNSLENLSDVRKTSSIVQMNAEELYFQLLKAKIISILFKKQLSDLLK